MIFKKSSISALVLLITVAAMSLTVLPSLHQSWLNNAWSLQFTRHALNPQTDQAVLANPPIGHARSVLWLSTYALQNGEPALSERLIAEQAAQGDPLSMNLMADALLAQNKFGEALKIGQQAGNADLLIKVASQAQQSGSLDDALLAYETAWKLDQEPGTLPFVNFLINNKKNYTQAEQILRLSMTKYSNSIYWSEWSCRLGYTLRNLKHWDDAAEAYETTLKHDPDDWVAQIGLGWVKYERGEELQAAMEEFQKAINNPKSQGYAHVAIAQVLAREKDYESADKWFADAITINPELKEWYIARGNSAQHANNINHALSIFLEAIERFPNFAPTYFEIAKVYRINNQPNESITAIEKAIDLINPPNVNYFLFAGSIYEWTEKLSLALDAYNQALLIDPQNPAALKGVERLNKK